jgi:hypothetical protein
MIQRLYRANTIADAKLFNRAHDGCVSRIRRDSFGSTKPSPTQPIIVRQNTNSTIPFILFILSRNLVAKNCLFANLALAADDVLISR